MCMYVHDSGGGSLGDYGSACVSLSSLKSAYETTLPLNIHDQQNSHALSRFFYQLIVRKLESRGNYIPL